MESFNKDKSANSTVLKYRRFMHPPVPLPTPIWLDNAVNEALPIGQPPVGVNSIVYPLVVLEYICPVNVTFKLVGVVAFSRISAHPIEVPDAGITSPKVNVILALADLANSNKLHEDEVLCVGVNVIVPTVRLRMPVGESSIVLLVNTVTLPANATSSILIVPLVIPNGAVDVVTPAERIMSYLYLRIALVAPSGTVNPPVLVVGRAAPPAEIWSTLEVDNSASGSMSNVMRCVSPAHATSPVVGTTPPSQVAGSL